MRTVARPMMINEATSTGLRPIRSPRWPPMMPPSGRAMKPTPSVANEAKVPISGSSLGKKTVPKYSAAAVPKPMKS